MWLVIVLLISGQIARKLGIRYLFLDPEYGGSVNFLSFFFLGIAFGGFFMTWNLTTYLLNAHYFPFLASLSRPFTKYCLNNFLLPLFFLVFYFSFVIGFQKGYEQLATDQILIHLLGFVVGLISMVVLYALYFSYTNRDISYYHQEETENVPPNLTKSIAPGRKDVDLEYIKLDVNRWKVKTYLTESFQARIVRSVAHYDSTLLRSIFKQNHLNALIMQLLSMMLLVILGYLIDNPGFRIPAGASIFILVSVLTAIVGALTYWFNEWRVTIIILLLFGVNFFTSFDAFNHKNKAYGLKYDDPYTEYSVEKLQSLLKDNQLEADISNTTSILNRWKKKAFAKPGQKPKMVLLCASGGGLKSASYTVNLVQKADSLLEGNLLRNTVLIAGSSGGSLGMAYLRELYLRKQSDPSINLYDRKYVENISKDLLNALSFTLVTNDLFLPWVPFEYDGIRYKKDRGYIFEEQFNENTEKILDKKLGDYLIPEQEAKIPMLYLAPSVLNDARRLIISPQGVSFMMVAPVGFDKPNSVEIDAVDFNLLFKDQPGNDIRFLSALRMNSTYPYVLPTVSLPTEPNIEVLDAGFLDNYGILSATRFIQVFKDWILENTSGVVLVQISSSSRIEQIEPNNNKGIIESLFDPLGIAGQLIVLQEFEQDNSLGFIYDLMGQENFEVIRFIYHPAEEDTPEASISFHITKKEREDVINSINLPSAQKSFDQLVRTLTE